MRNKKMMKWGRVVALVLILVLLIPFIGRKKDDSPPVEQTIVVEDANDAITKLAESEVNYGYENALSELTEKSSVTINGDNYYRLQQNYQGIPVYGRTVVCATDENGKITSTTGNVLDINENIDLEPTVTDEDVYNSIVDYATESLNSVGELVAIPQLSENNLVVYVEDNGIATLAYQMEIILGGEPYSVVIDAQSAKLYVINPLIRTDYITIAYPLGNGDKTVDLNIDTDNDRYTLYDEVRNIELYSANNEELSVYYIFYDANDEILYYYYFDSGKWLNTNNEEINIPTEAYEYVKYGFTTQKKIQGVTNIFAASVTDFSQEALQTMGYLANVADFFQETFDRNGYANDSLKYLPVVYNCSNGSYSRTCLGISMLSLKTGAGLNTVAHEFMHSVEASESAMQYSGESGAIMEALSDIFAELAEYYYYEHCDWLYNGGVRNLVDPSLSTEDNTPHPSTYRGKNWYSGSKDYGGVHYNSTVISHAAYLMSEDSGGLLDMDDLAQLWYRAMLMMPSDCDFEECRQIVELAATSMELTTAQIECVSDAFDAVGITGKSNEDDSDVTYKVGLNGTLNVYGGDGKLCGNYTLVMAQKKLFDIDNSGVRITRYITSAESYDLSGLSEGKYTFTITDGTNANNTLTFTVSVSKKYNSSRVDVFTNFGCTSVKGTVSEIKEVNGVDTNVPVANAVVKVYSHAEESVVETIYMSETDGYFEVCLPIGNYSFTVEAEGYISSTTSFEVTADHSEYLEIVLKPGKQKQLSSIITYQDGKITEEYHLTYNSLGQVISLIFYRYENGNFVALSTENYVYDGNGNPILIDHVTSRGTVQAYHYQYDYDADGRITGYSYVEYYDGSPGSSDAYTFSYDNQGQVVERRNEYGSSVEEFSYDESGKIVYESSDLYWGDGHFIESRVYDYSYAPFVIISYTSESKEYGNSSGKTISFRPHWNLTIASWSIDDTYTFVTDTSGCLIEVLDTNGKKICEFKYEN